MENNFQISDEIIKKIKEIIKKMHFSEKNIKVFLFGSRIQNQSQERSDIDIGLENINQQKIPATFKFDFQDELEKIPTLLQFDIVDFSIVNDSFKKEAMKNIYYLN